MVKTLKVMLPQPSQQKSTIRWQDFEPIISKVENERISLKNYALLNLLWSEMTVEEIQGLRKLDFDFDKRLIRCSGNDYRATKDFGRLWISF